MYERSEILGCQCNVAHQNLLRRVGHVIYQLHLIIDYFNTLCIKMLKTFDEAYHEFIIKSYFLNSEKTTTDFHNGRVISISTRISYTV